MKYRKAAAIPGKCDAQLHFDFHQQEMLPRLAQAGRGERKIFFADAAHFVMGAFLGMLWCFGRMFIKTAPGRQRSDLSKRPHSGGLMHQVGFRGLLRVGAAC
ncbi:MAG: hypothetical protein ACKVY0_06045 [Prosthecobacter sp.]|uniref:hypothetical protein n=1 Tax=Prosthecobacter sp. TaxID=1965333 RepID=UPI00390279C6